MRSFSSLVSALAAACLLAVAPSAHAAPTNAEALTAIQKVDPSIGLVTSNVASNDDTRAAVVATRTSGAGTGAQDLWLVGDDGSAVAVTSYRTGDVASAPGIGEPAWSNDDAKVVLSTNVESQADSLVLTIYTTGSAPSTFATVPYGLGANFTDDGRYAAVLQLDTPHMKFFESAVDLQTGAVYQAYSVGTSGVMTVSPECARSQQAGWTAAIESEDILIEWLAGPDPGCTFPTAASPGPQPTASPTPKPTATPTPKPTATPKATPRPSSSTPVVQSATVSPFALVSYAQSLKAARSRGLRVKVQVPEETTLKAWLIGKDGKTLARRSQSATAGAVAMTIPLTSSAKRALRKKHSVTVTLRLIGTAGGKLVTVEHPLSLTGG